jgi:methylthioribose-1-phosphate isomerase
VSGATGITLLDNVARLDADGVHVFDRRRYPFELSWVGCRTVNEVARAIIDMVTQSHGPTVVAGYGMALAAREALAEADPVSALRRSASVLVDTRPTNDSLRRIVAGILDACLVAAPAEWEALAIEHVDDHVRVRRAVADRIGGHGSMLLPERARLLTHCWAETGIAQIVQHAVGAGKSVTAFCAETRPYLQGSRLTADALRDAGADVIVIPDAAVGYLITEGGVDLAITGTDRVTADGGVVNKIGTRAIATLAASSGVPYYPICTEVDRETASVDDVVIELRNGEEALECLGTRTATHGVSGFYPAFDRTPAALVTAYITPDGVVDASALGLLA